MSYMVLELRGVAGGRKAHKGCVSIWIGHPREEPSATPAFKGYGGERSQRRMNWRGGCGEPVSRKREGRGEMLLESG